MTRNQKRLLNLDILRLVSAMLVLIFHYGFRMGVTGEGGGIRFPEFAPAAIWFDSGLLIFFAISGYVITLSAEGRTAFDFAVGRVARLWPAFVLCASATAIVLYNWPVPGLPTPTVKQWLAHLVINARVLGQPFLDGAYWTIAYEVMFYGWVFVFIALGWFRKHWQAIVVSWLVLSVANELRIDSEVLRKLFITEYSGYFVFGMTLYKLRQGQTPGALVILAASILWAAATPFIIEPKFFELYGIHRSAAGLALTGPITVSCVTLCVMLPTLPIRPAIATGIGGLTYPLYLLHQHIGYATFTRFGADHSRWLVGAILVATLLFASWLIAAFFEPPARRLIGNFARRVATAISIRRAKSQPQIP
ncbi:acyltransferase family protein [Pseudaminobacter salicylatoxidans]|uniref:acyltransferase family protein n=1 Tax=Pseudaminobacter salicylatoxidans TaxID=93369 RepID=UPI0002EECE30|nr:acyltransferase [Pseudaminobacter salicylatoxidans]